MHTFSSTLVSLTSLIVAMTLASRSIVMHSSRYWRCVVQVSTHHSHLTDVRGFGYGHICWFI